MYPYPFPSLNNSVSYIKFKPLKILSIFPNYQISPFSLSSPKTLSLPNTLSSDYFASSSFKPSFSITSLPRTSQIMTSPSENLNLAIIPFENHESPFILPDILLIDSFGNTSCLSAHEGCVDSRGR